MDRQQTSGATSQPLKTMHPQNKIKYLVFHEVIYPNETVSCYDIYLFFKRNLKKNPKSTPAPAHGDRQPLLIPWERCTSFGCDRLAHARTQRHQLLCLQAPLTSGGGLAASPQHRLQETLSPKVLTNLCLWAIYSHKSQNNLFKSVNL